MVLISESKGSLLAVTFLMECARVSEGKENKIQFPNTIQHQYKKVIVEWHVFDYFSIDTHCQATAARR